MTAQAPELERAPEAVSRRIRDLPRLVEHFAILAMLAWWAVPFTRAQGGRGVHNELLFGAVMVVVLAALQVWRSPAGSLVTAAAVALAAVLVCLFAPSGWYGADVAADYVLAAAVYAATRRYVRDDERRNLIAAAICLAGLYQFEQSFLAWWGSRNPSAEMSGTFYWHNPYAAFLLPGAVIGLGLITTRRSPWTYVGWTSAPICAAGIVFSSSRATMATLVVAWVLVLAASAFERATLIRVVGGIALAVGLTFVLPGPPFFPHRASPLSATTGRNDTGQTLAQNGVYRTQFWRESAQVALHRPLVGGGYHTLAKASALYTPSGWARSPLAHDGYLQALSDGGLLLGLPFLFAVAVVVFWALRRFWALISRRERRVIDITGLTIVVSLLGGFAHSAVDFDWSHPSLLAQAGLLAACVAPLSLPPRAASRGWRRATAPGAALGLMAVLVMCLPALHQWQIDQPQSTQSTAALLADAQAPFGDYRPATQILEDLVAGRRTATATQVASAVRLTADDASVDIHLQLLRYAAAAEIGALPDALAAARAELRHVHGSTAPYVPDLAQVAIDSGDLGVARRLLAADLRQVVSANAVAPDTVEELLMWGRSLGRGSAYACYVADVSRIGGPNLVAGVLVPQGSCPARSDQALGR